MKLNFSFIFLIFRVFHRTFAAEKRYLVAQWLLSIHFTKPFQARNSKRFCVIFRKTELEQKANNVSLSGFVQRQNIDI